MPEFSGGSRVALGLGKLYFVYPRIDRFALGPTLTLSFRPLRSITGADIRSVLSSLAILYLRRFCTSARTEMMLIEGELEAARPRFQALYTVVPFLYSPATISLLLS